MSIELNRSIPEELFSEKIGSDERNRNFYRAYPPKLNNLDKVTRYPDISGENQDWRFSNFDEQSGEVKVVVPADFADKPNAIFAEDRLPLLEFYLLNPEQAPTDLKLPLSMYLNVWDAYSPSSSEKFCHHGSEIMDDSWDAIEADENISAHKLNTLLSVPEAKQIITQLNAKLARHRSKPAPAPDKRQQEFADYDRLRRTALFDSLPN
jgi:hypothetical protein